MIPAAGLVVAERFRLIKPLGEGGMGAVWVAQHTQLDIPCALKFIHAEGAASEELRARFEREAKAAAQLRTPHVVQILDHGVWDGTPYIAMELLEGEDLSQRLARLGRLDAAATVGVVSQVARALTKAHGAGLVHRDLKPANIYLVRDDDREIAKVLDFGIAKAASTLGSESKTKTGSLMGTPYYMSPEQAQGTKTVDLRSDLWALGVVVFECLTGELPFQSEAFGDLLLRIMMQPLPVPSEVAPVPAGFDAWWERAACRDPGGRFQSARELSDALAVALGLGAAGLGEIGSAAPSMAGARVSAATLATLEDPSTDSRSAVAARTAAGLGAGTQIGGFAQSFEALRPAEPDEATDPPAGPALDASPEVAPSPAKRRRELALALGVLAVLGLGGALAYASLGHTAAPDSPVTAALPPTGPATVTPAVATATASGPAQPAPSASETTPVIVAPAGTVAPAATVAPAVTAVASAATPPAPIRRVPTASVPLVRPPPPSRPRPKTDFGI